VRLNAEFLKWKQNCSIKFLDWQEQNKKGRKRRGGEGGGEEKENTGSMGRGNRTRRRMSKQREIYHNI
jgi:hypothetical protein